MNWNVSRKPLCLIAMFAAGIAQAEVQAGSRVDVQLSSGDVIRGVLVSSDEKSHVIDHPVLGRVTLAVESVAGVVAVADPAVLPAKPVEASPAPAEKKEEKAAVPAATPPAAPVDPTSFWSGWKSTAEAGVNGAEGNSTSLSARAAINTKRETSKMVTTASASYVYGSQNSDKNLEHGELNVRNDWKLEGPWRLYATGKGEYDSFQDWDIRVSAFGGVGYEFIKSEKTTLLGRVGAGASKEFGSSKQRIEPELNLGVDWARIIDDRQKLFATVDLYPSLHKTSDYRLNVQAGYEVVVDPESNFSLKLGIEDRYNSNPGGDRKKNDLLYFATLVTGF